MNYDKQLELLRAIRPYKDVMIPYSVQKLSDVGMGLGARPRIELNGIRA